MEVEEGRHQRALSDFVQLVNQLPAEGEGLLAKGAVRKVHELQISYYTRLLPPLATNAGPTLIPGLPNRNCLTTAGVGRVRASGVAPKSVLATGSRHYSRKEEPIIMSLLA